MLVDQLIIPLMTATHKGTCKNTAPATTPEEGNRDGDRAVRVRAAKGTLSVGCGHGRFSHHARFGAGIGDVKAACLSEPQEPFWCQPVANQMSSVQLCCPTVMGSRRSVQSGAGIEMVMGCLRPAHDLAKGHNWLEGVPFFFVVSTLAFLRPSTLRAINGGNESSTPLALFSAWYVEEGGRGSKLNRLLKLLHCGSA